jgi:NAD(P)-dependent dehydrogenase (short-subunit alcohol dehydrogenase family)
MWAAVTPGRLADIAETYGDQVRIAALDVTDEAAAQAAVEVAVAAFGGLDVLINTPAMPISVRSNKRGPEDFKKLADTCFYGVVNLARAALPVMRKQRSGHIIQISSAGGRFATAGGTAYDAAKWAVGGFTEALAQETAPFGVRVCAVEPGSMRTNRRARAVHLVAQAEQARAADGERWRETSVSTDVGSSSSVMGETIGH